MLAAIRQVKEAATQGRPERFLDQLHHDEALAVVLADVVDCDDVRMIERGGRTGFANEAIDRRRILRETGA